MIRRRSIVCADCGRSHDETPLRQLYPEWVPHPYTCRDCYQPGSGTAPGTGGLDYPAWDDLPEVGRE